MDLSLKGKDNVPIIPWIPKISRQENKFKVSGIITLKLYLDLSSAIELSLTLSSKESNWELSIKVGHSIASKEGASSTCSTIIHFYKNRKCGYFESELLLLI